MAMTKCGGISDSKAADKEIQGLCDKVKSAILGKLDFEPPEFVAVRYTSQVVAGTNYFVKIKLDGDKHIHARIFQPLPHVGSGPELNSILDNKKLEDPIEYF